MGTDLVTTPGWNTLTVPDPGEAVRAATLAGAVRPGYQELVDRCGALGYGHKKVRVWCDAAPDVVIAPLGWVFLKDSGGDWLALEHSSPTTFDVQAEIISVYGAVASSTRYYIYAYESASAIAFTVSTTAPDSALNYQSGDEKYVFVSMVFTNSGSSIISFSHYGRRYLYLGRQTTGGGNVGNLLLDGGNATVQTSINLNQSMFRNLALTLILHCRYSGSGVSGAAYIGPVGFVYEHLGIFVDVGQFSSAQVEIPIVPASTTQIDYKITDNTNLLYIWTSGFTF